MPVRRLGVLARSVGPVRVFGAPGSVLTRGANDASRVRVQLSSSRVVNISSRARARVKLALESSLLESSFDRVLIESSPSSSRVVSFH